MRTRVEHRSATRAHAYATILLVAFSMLGAARSEAGWVSLPHGPVASPAFGRHDDVFFVSADSGWVVNGAGEIHRTTDGGQSWTLQATMPNYLRSVGFATRLKGWAGALYGPPLLYATQDAGVTWTPVTNIPDPQPSGICGLWVVNDSVAYGCGRFDGPPATMIKTTDGGVTWTSWDMAAYATSLIDCYFFDANHGFVVGGTGPFTARQAVILATSDGGATWQTRYEGDRVGAEWCWKVSFATPSNGFVSIEREDGLAPTYVLESTDGGMDWNEVPFINGYDMQGVGFVTPSMGWVGGWGGITYETLDAGASWHPAGFGNYVNRFRFLSPTLGYAVGDSVYKYTADATAVADEPKGTQALALGQNLPNPMRNTTLIPFTLGAASHVRVSILDVQGRTKVTLFDSIRPAGKTELAWNGCDRNGNPVGTGVYWCRVETPAESRERKLIVVR